VAFATEKSWTAAADEPLAPIQEEVKRASNFRPVAFSGRLQDALAWKPSEATRALRDVEIVGDEMTVEERIVAAREPRVPRRPLGYGWNCEVWISVNGVKLKVLLDSGASRNIIQKKLRMQLQADSTTSARVEGPFAGDRTISISGIHAGQDRSPDNDIDTIFALHFSFIGSHGTDGLTSTNRREELALGPCGHPLKVEFGELPSSADGLLIGCPHLATWGYSIKRDGHFNRKPLVYLEHLNLWCPMVNCQDNDELENTIQTGRSQNRTA
jgi:hypothetical protein